MDSVDKSAFHICVFSRNKFICLDAVYSTKKASMFFCSFGFSRLGNIVKSKALMQRVSKHTWENKYCQILSVKIKREVLEVPNSCI